MRLNELSDRANSSKRRTRIGRGIGSGKGKTSGRGHKGQKSRSGAKIPAGFEGGQMPLYRRLPKRGFNNPFRKNFAVINLGAIQKALDKGILDPNVQINNELLLESDLVKSSRDGVRLLAKGTISTKIEISVDGASRAAIAAVEEAGGSVAIPEPKLKPEGKGKARHRKKEEREAKLANFLESEDG